MSNLNEKKSKSVNSKNSERKNILKKHSLVYFRLSEL